MPTFSPTFLPRAPQGAILDLRDGTKDRLVKIDNAHPFFPVRGVVNAYSIHGRFNGPGGPESPLDILSFRADSLVQDAQDAQDVAEPNGISSTLQERGQRYGEFPDHARITQNLKLEMQTHSGINGVGWMRLSKTQKESLEMIAHKIGRILNGNPNYIDSWHDIAGYATLVEQELQKNLPQAQDKA